MTENGTGQYERSRRDFLKYILGGSIIAWLAAVLYPVLAYLKPPKQGEVAVTSVKAGKVTTFAKDSGTIIRFGNKPVILVRTSGGELRAFSATCTHLNCTVQYQETRHQIWCACHNGFYDLNGRVVSGPPPRPLDEYAVHIRGEEVVVSRRT